MDEDRYEGSDDEERFERSRRRTAVAPGPPGNQHERSAKICIREYIDSPVATSTAGTPEGTGDRLRWSCLQSRVKVVLFGSRCREGLHGP